MPDEVFTSSKTPRPKRRAREPVTYKKAGPKGGPAPFALSTIGGLDNRWSPQNESFNQRNL